MDPRQRGPIGLVIVAILVGACGGAGSPTPSPVGAAGAPAASEPAASSPGPSGSLATGAGAAVAVDPAQDVTPAPASKPLPVATLAPTPTPVSVATNWTRPTRVGTLKTCSTVTAGIDAANRAHVAAECGGSIRYYASTDGRSWSTTVFAHPAHREDLDPQIAFQGNLVYVAYTRIAPDGGCGGGRGEAIGVFVRSRSLPDGAWSTARRIGRPGDTAGGLPGRGCDHPRHGLEQPGRSRLRWARPGRLRDARRFGHAPLPDPRRGRANGDAHRVRWPCPDRLRDRDRDPLRDLYRRRLCDDAHHQEQLG